MTLCLFANLHTDPFSEKGLILTGKNIHPVEANSFISEQIPF